MIKKERDEGTGIRRVDGMISGTVDDKFQRGCCRKNMVRL
jgi:hypothetical protein